jgi:hypothetical protein
MDIRDRRFSQIFASKLEAIILMPLISIKETCLRYFRFVHFVHFFHFNPPENLQREYRFDYSGYSSEFLAKTVQ